MSPGRVSGGQGTGGALVLAGASLWGLIGLFNRALMGAGLSPRSIVLVRNLGGLAVLALVLLVWKRDAFRVSPRHLGWFFGTGVVSVLLFTWCYFSCQEQCSLAVAAILLYTSPAFVVVLSALLWREKLTRRKLAALGLTFGGCVLVTGVLSGGAQLTPAGFLLGLGAGFFYALYSIFGRYALAHYGPYTVTLYTFLFAGAGALVFLDPAELGARGRRGPCRQPWGWWWCPPSCPTCCTPPAWPGWRAAGPPSWPRWSRLWPPWWGPWPFTSP